MLARLVRFSVGPGNGAVIQGIADDLAPQISAQPGCLGITVFGDDADGEGGMFVLWESRSAADAAAVVMGPQLNAHLAGFAPEGPQVRLFDVLTTMSQR